MYKSVGVLFMRKSRKEVFWVQYNLIKSQQIKIKDTLCMQCGHQSVNAPLSCHDLALSY